jgi:diaminohydroxyphosphoribosylaminopyrimidine deaminase / 5-amino-6-(5-phosphoribosylamino)uracil reductase
MEKEQHLRWMNHAVTLARKGEGRTSPNPPVGAVIVHEGKLVGEGFHPRAGEPHAEVFALHHAGESARGSTIYVTLEPCSHFGKTPPCADALISAGVKTVYVGVSDPNPQVAGRGIERLRAAGIEVYTGLLEDECRQLIAAFKKHIETGLPYTVYKSAMTLDGNTATESGDSRWVSGSESRQRVHRLRNRVDAILVGVDTVCHDDPLLNTRLDGDSGQDPLRIVVDSHLRIPINSRLFQQESDATTIVATTCRDKDKISALEDVGAEVVILSENEGRVSLPELWRELGKRNIQKLLLEGGATLAGAALKAGLIDQLMLFIAPKLLGGVTQHGILNGASCNLMAEAIRLENHHFEQVGDDLLITGDIVQCLPD